MDKEHIIFRNERGQFAKEVRKPLVEPLATPQYNITHATLDDRLETVRGELADIQALTKVPESTSPIEIKMPELKGGAEMKILGGKGIKRRTYGEEKLVSKDNVTEFLQRHLAFGDSQYPDVDMTAIDAILNLNKDYKATHVWLMGDMLNVTTLSKFGFPADYKITLGDEIRGTRELLKHIVTSVKKSNKEVEIHYLEGNHEKRLKSFMDKNAALLDDLDETNGDKTIDLPRLLGLKELGIKWTPYWDDDSINKDVTILHGNLARVKAGYTAQAYIDKYGKSTIAGHDHRLALVFRTQSGDVKFGAETGSTCRRDMIVPYTRAGQTDWQQGLVLLGVDQDGDNHPLAVPIINGKVAFGNKVYKG